MKKKITLIALFMVIASASFVKAEVTNSINDQNTQTVKVAVVNDLVKDAIKQGIYSIGTMMLNRLNNQSGSSSTYYSSPTYNTTTESTTPTTTSTSTITDTTTQPTEEMIPVS